MSSPRVSVVIPCFNTAATVSETIASVSAQSISDFEIIAVDNNCTDNTADILAELAKQEPRLRIIREPVQGLSAARNGGIRAACGQFIALLDADDLWDPDYLEQHLVNLSDPEVGVSYSPVRMIDMAGRPTGHTTNPQLSGLTSTDLLRSNPCTALIVVRVEVFRTVGLFDRRLRAVEDQEWLFRAAHSGTKLAGIDKVLASYRITPGGLSADLDSMQQNHERLLEAAARIAPNLLAKNRRLARAAMLRYCARRAMEHSKGNGIARKYLWQMILAAPELLLHEPLTTTKTAARVMLPGVQSWLPRRSQPLQAGEV